jgi:HK97 gp10 family phage protein
MPGTPAAKMEFKNEELLRKLQALKGAATGDALVQVLEVAGAFIEGRAKMRAPVDTGNLRNSIQTRAQSTGASSAQVTVGTSVDYAAAQEFGAPSRGLPARPYMRQALNDNRDKVEAIIADRIKKEIGAV